MKKILPFFSYLFHPIFISVYAALYYFFVYNSYHSNIEKFVALFQIALVTILLPILIFIVLRATGQVHSIMVAEISQRKIPLLLQCFLALFLIQKCITINHFPELHLFFLGGLTTTLIALILIFFNTKASLHMLTISAVTIFVIGLSIHNQTQHINWIAFFVLMNGFVASSRLEMEAHTPKELVIGFLIGALPQLLLMPLWL